MSGLVTAVPGVMTAIASVDDVSTMTVEVSCMVDIFTEPGI